MTKAHVRLMAAAITTYGFRPPTAQDQPHLYLAALIRHVADRDLAAAYELQVGKPQAEWTPAEVQGFVDGITAMPGPKRAFAPDDGIQVVKAISISGYEATEACLLEIATKTLALFRAEREADATLALPIMANVLTVTGDLLATRIGDRSQRVAVLKALAQQTPAFGFFLVADSFIHSITNGTATKTDALLAHVGTRDLRITMRRPYQVVQGRAVFADPPPPDLDLHAHSATDDYVDAYSEVFVSVPPAGGVQ